MLGELRLRYSGESLREATISIGVAMYLQNTGTLEQVLRVADRALYEAKHHAAKHGRRNRVILAAQPAGTQTLVSQAVCSHIALFRAIPVTPPCWSLFPALAAS